jgi:hypothetical protein
MDFIDTHFFVTPFNNSGKKFKEISVGITTGNFDIYYSEIIPQNITKHKLLKYLKGKYGGLDWSNFTNQPSNYADYKYANGGEIVDLFEDYENIPENVQEVLDRYSEKYGEDFSEMDYNYMAEMHKEIEKIGYTFDSGLDNMPYGLRPIGIELNQLRGYEEYGLGGFLLGAGVGALGYKLYLESKTKKGKEKIKRTYNKVKKKVGL